MKKNSGVIKSILLALFFSTVLTIALCVLPFRAAAAETEITVNFVTGTNNNTLVSSAGTGWKVEVTQDSKTLAIEAGYRVVGYTANGHELADKSFHVQYTSQLDEINNNGVLSFGVFGKDHVVDVMNCGVISGGVFTISNNCFNIGTITGGVFVEAYSGCLSNYENATIRGGIFYCPVINLGTITGGDFIQSRLTNIRDGSVMGISEISEHFVNVEKHYTNVSPSHYISDYMEIFEIKRKMYTDKVYHIPDANTIAGLYLLNPGDPAPSAPFSIQDDFRLKTLSNTYEFTMPDKDIRLYIIGNDYVNNTLGATTGLSFGTEDNRFLVSWSQNVCQENNMPASGYSLQLYRNGIPVGAPVETTCLSYDFSDMIPTADSQKLSGCYTFGITALGDGINTFTGAEEMSDRLYYVAQSNSVHCNTEPYIALRDAPPCVVPMTKASNTEQVSDWLVNQWIYTTTVPGKLFDLETEYPSVDWVNAEFSISCIVYSPAIAPTADDTDGTDGYMFFRIKMGDLIIEQDICCIISATDYNETHGLVYIWTYLDGDYWKNNDVKLKSTSDNSEYPLSFDANGNCYSASVPVGEYEIYVNDNLCNEPITIDTARHAAKPEYFTVKFETVGADFAPVIPPVYTVIKGSKINALNIYISKDGNAPEHWYYTTPDGNTVWDFENDSVTSALTLNPKWPGYFTAIINLKKDNVFWNNQKVCLKLSSDESVFVVLNSNNNIYSASVLSGDYKIFVNDIYVKNITVEENMENQTLYYYTVTCNINGANGALPAQNEFIVPKGSKLKSPPIYIFNDGKQPVSWHTNPNLENASKWNFESSVSETITLYPKWPEKTGVIESASLTLGSNLTVNYYAKVYNCSSSKLTMRWTMNGNTVSGSGAATGQPDEYVFCFEGISPQCMGDNISAELVYDNNKVLAVKEEYSVKSYCVNMLNKSDDELEALLPATATETELRSLLKDVLVYGGAAQIYTGYKTEDLVNYGITGTAYERVYANETVKYISGSINEDAYFTAAGVWFSNNNRVYWKIKTADASKLTVNIYSIALNSMAQVFEKTCTLDNSGLTATGEEGEYILYSTDISATGFATAYNAVITYDGSTAQSATYSVNSYIYSKQDETTAIGTLVKALRNYGKSASAYVSE